MKCKTSKQNAKKEQDIRTTGQSEMGKYQGISKKTRQIVQAVPDIAKGQSLLFCSQSTESTLANFPESNHEPLQRTEFFFSYEARLLMRRKKILKDYQDRGEIFKNESRNTGEKTNSTKAF